MATVSKSELESALGKIKEVLGQHGLAVPQELEELQRGLDKAAEAFQQYEQAKQQCEQAKKEVERLRGEVTNKLNELRPNWPEKVQGTLEHGEEPCWTINPDNCLKFEIDPDTDLD